MNVLVVSVDPEIRQVVGWVLEELDLPATLVATWREALSAAGDQPPQVTLADLDDVGVDDRGLVALLRTAERAIRLGAVAGLRKPLNVGALFTALRRLIEDTSSPEHGF